MRACLSEDFMSIAFSGPDLWSFLAKSKSKTFGCIFENLFITSKFLNTDKRYYSPSLNLCLDLLICDKLTVISLTGTSYHKLMDGSHHIENFVYVLEKQRN